MLALGKQHLAQIAAERPEGDRLDARPICARERCADMVAAGPVGENHPMGGKREERRRIAGAIRSGLVEKLDQIEIGARRGQRAVELKPADCRYFDCMASVR